MPNSSTQGKFRQHEINSKLEKFFKEHKKNIN